MSQFCVTAIRIQHLINMKYRAHARKSDDWGLIQNAFFTPWTIYTVFSMSVSIFINGIQSICTQREVSEAAVCLLPIFKPDQMGDNHFVG